MRRTILAVSIAAAFALSGCASGLAVSWDVSVTYNRPAAAAANAAAVPVVAVPAPPAPPASAAK